MKIRGLVQEAGYFSVCSSSRVYATRCNRRHSARVYAAYCRGRHPAIFTHHTHSLLRALSPPPPEGLIPARRSLTLVNGSRLCDVLHAPYPFPLPPARPPSLPLPLSPSLPPTIHPSIHLDLTYFSTLFVMALRQRGRLCAIMQQPLSPSACAGTVETTPAPSAQRMPGFLWGAPRRRRSRHLSVPIRIL